MRIVGHVVSALICLVGVSHAFTLNTAVRTLPRTQSKCPLVLMQLSDMQSKLESMKAAAAARTPFSEAELDSAVGSLQCLAPEADIDWVALRTLYASRAHLNHKVWSDTETSAEQLAAILGGPSDAPFRQMFARVLDGGSWDAAAAFAASRPTDAKPWIVLVTGLNGIRKTTSINEHWFKELLRQALGAQYEGEPPEMLPAGGDSFFRQLDFMIATVALNEFKTLYTIEDVALYAALKEAIFARYRTIAEMLGVLLVRAAQREGISVMVETSGRDVGMYQYIEHLQPDDAYRKLVVNFAINDLSFAEKSVDSRMLLEMRFGRAALARADSEPLGLVKANAGGPYGSAVLAGVQADSVRVWQSIVAGGEGDVGHGWHKASIAIEARENAPWRARAVIAPADGTTAATPTPYEFGSVGTA